MLCPKCGYYSDREESVCPECGNILQPPSGIPKEGPQAIRQGKRARDAVRMRQERPAAQETAGRRSHTGARRGVQKMPTVKDTRRTAELDEESPETAEDYGIERRRRTFYDETAGESTAMRYLSSHEGPAPHRMVNWMKVSIVVAVVMAILAGGAWVFLKKTDAGQRVLARMGRDANSVAYWAVGDEKLDSGDVDGAIECYMIAREKDAKAEVPFVDVDGLLTLASALEAADRMDEAAELYRQIYEETPSRTEAYVNHIRILQNSGSEEDLVTAGELMKKAYQQTGEKTFLTQRNDLLPAPPQVKPDAGNYDAKKTIVFSSYQGYDVYFTYNNEDAKLPEEGILATKEGHQLDEGVWNIRAVAVNGKLVSDELRATYKIIMPSPMTPRATLAPNTYKTRQTVKLKPGLDDERDSSIVIYYTIDGSIPNSDSPVFNGDPIALPNGWVTLKAYAVNRYNKLSNMLEINYKIEAKPWPNSVFDSEDTVDSLKIFKTTQQEFTAAYGAGTAAGSVNIEGFEKECRRFDYPWGYAIMTLEKKNWVLVEVSFNSGAMAGPRGTKIGDTEEYVVGRFKDMGQVESKSGNRGLYSTDKGSGKIWLQENNEKIIRYRYGVDSSWVQLEYLVSASGTVKNITLKYIP